jgi:hypothetical protein
MELTPFEKAAQNKILHPKRMALCHKVTEMIRQLEEAEMFLEIAEAQQQDSIHGIGMYDPELIDTVRSEANTLMRTLSIVASTWEQMEGVNA